MPNLAVVTTVSGTFPSMLKPASASLTNLEGEFSKYLISNAEMEQYEAEYQRCASIIANGSIEQLATAQVPGGQNMSPNNGQPQPQQNNDMSQPPQQPQLQPQFNMTYQNVSMTTIPSTPPMGIPRSQVRSGSPTKASPSMPYLKQGSPPPPPPPPTSYANVTNGVANFAQSTISNISKVTAFQLLSNCFLI